MLSNRLLSAIYLLHESAGTLSASDSLPLSAEERYTLSDLLCRKGYLDSSGCCICNLNDLSLWDLLRDLGEKLDPCLSPRSSDSFPPFLFLDTLERTSRLWLSSIKVSEL